MPTPLRAVEKPAPETASERVRRLQAEAVAAANDAAQELVADLAGMVSRCDEVLSFDLHPGLMNEIRHIRREIQTRLDTIAAIGARG